MIMIKTDSKLIDEILTRSVAAVYPSRDALKAKLTSGQQLRVYMGIDPTADYIHLGHSTNYFMLERLHALGHKIIVLVGDFTAMIGDPSDKTSARKQLTSDDVKRNMVTFKEQIGHILDFSSPANPIEFKYNSEWLGKLDFEMLAELASQFTVQQMIERDAFKKRLGERKPLYVHEFFYPLMQGYDSVAMDVDLEIGGTDQTFNMLAGRTLVTRYKHHDKFVIASTLLENPLTGEKLMSKSLGTGISLKEDAVNMFGKIMAFPDQAIVQLYIDCTRVPMPAIDGLREQLAAGANPFDAKFSLATEIVTIYHGADAALTAADGWKRQFRDKAQPTDIVEQGISISGTMKIDNPDYYRNLYISALVETGLAGSRNKAVALFEQNGVKLNGQPLSLSDKITIKDGDILQVGKLNFVKLKLT